MTKNLCNNLEQKVILFYVRYLFYFFLLRKIYEAYFIYNQKPEINDKSEIKLLQRFLVNGDVIHSDLLFCFILFILFCLSAAGYLSNHEYTLICTVSRSYCYVYMLSLSVCMLKSFQY